MARGSDMGKLVSAGGAAAALGGAYKLGEFLYKAKRLRDVGPSNAVYVRLIGRVQSDLDEVRRLLAVREVHDALEANPDKAKWVYGAVRDVRGALENITPHTERVASDVDDGRRVGLRHRVYWLLSEKEKLENREKEVSIAHASLTEVIGYLTGLEPDTSKKPHDRHEKHEKHDRHDARRDVHVDKHVDIDIDVRHEEGPHRREKDVWIERDDRGPRRVTEERETWVEHDTVRRGPRRVEEHHVEHEHRGPGHYDVRETWVDEHGRPRRYEEREVYEEHGRDPRYESHYEAHHQDHRHDDRHVERGLHVERDPRDPGHVDARYYERGPSRYEEKRYEERRINEPLGRRPESFEDRVPDRETWMQSDGRRPPPGQYSRYNDYAEYGAPQPSGAANYRLPPNPEYEREVWVEEKEDFRYDEYGNRLPDRYFPNLPRSRL
ncbi:hypothetical protein BU23DRAFT_551808 [Bimuria novae-zelandiae CBS 107.79]|uniref:Uncharacterized protein n=1 Tax=Bimuria novae-zelandiae CBS 107.79 TaxID=1447943 RepID=A0A6A5VN01_9PLEO|nr:hypothetical protein BU23DRAFT_551808 [Bimuria novae-zelandiae CBS 107.79]